MTLIRPDSWRRIVFAKTINMPHISNNHANTSNPNVLFSLSQTKENPAHTSRVTHSGIAGWYCRFNVVVVKNQHTVYDANKVALRSIKWALFRSKNRLNESNSIWKLNHQLNLDDWYNHANQIIKMYNFECMNVCAGNGLRFSYTQFSKDQFSIWSYEMLLKFMGE